MADLRWSEHGHAMLQRDGVVQIFCRCGNPDCWVKRRARGSQ